MTIERLRGMPSSLNDACRRLDEAADRIEKLEEALQYIADNAEDLLQSELRAVVHAALK